MHSRSILPPGNLAKTDGLVPPVRSRFVCGVHLRASLPVASNRAFIRAWAARRAQAGSALRAATGLAK
jgi:hypothetical protein